MGWDERFDYQNEEDSYGLYDRLYDRLYDTYLNLKKFYNFIRKGKDGLVQKITKESTLDSK